DGGIKPDLLAPGVGLATAEAGAAADGGSVFATVSGSSAAAAVVAGGAALLAEARPEAGAAGLRGLLVGGARPIGKTPVAAQGAGLLDVGRSSSLELVADPPSLTVTPLAGVPLHVPWAVVLRPARALLGPLTLPRAGFKPSESKPAIVVVRAGRVLRSAEGNTVVPVLRLDVELWTEDGKRLGLLTRLRDLLPGRYAIGLTGRGPGGKVLRRGSYRLRVFAWPTGGGPPTVRSIRFRIK